MLSRTDTAEERAWHMPPVEAADIPTRDGDGGDEAALRRAMYERIARGNTLAEAEDAARRAWRGE